MAVALSLSALASPRALALTRTQAEPKPDLPKAVAWVKRESEKGLKRRIQSAPDLTRLVG